MNPLQFYYFGCMDRPGHYMFAASGSPRRHYEQQPFKGLDGGLCPEGKQTQGRALIHHRDGWTALSFWDRTVDARGGCNSNFLANRTFGFDEMLDLARQHFPSVMKRLPFDIVDVTPAPSPQRDLSPGAGKDAE